jgi:predicted Zn-dependent protease
MRSIKSTILALGLPLLMAAVYLGVTLKPWAHHEKSYSQLSGQQSSELWNQCNLLFKQGKYREALPDVLELHAAYPGNHIYIERAAEIYDGLGRYDQAAEFWEKYFDRAPLPVTACPQIGQAYWKQDKQKEAIAAFERCLACDPENTDSIFFLAHARELAGDTAGAGELYQRGLKIAPGYTDMRTGLARVQFHQGNTARAKKTVAAILEQNPNNVDALLVAGLIYSREDDLAHARQYLERGVKLSEGYLDFHVALARIAEAERNAPEAIRHYDRILQERPDDKLIRAKRDALTERP